MQHKKKQTHAFTTQNILYAGAHTQKQLQPQSKKVNTYNYK